MSVWDPLQPDGKGRKRRQFLSDLPEFETKGKTEKRTVCRGKSESLREEENRNYRLVGVAETGKEFAE